MYNADLKFYIKYFKSFDVVDLKREDEKFINIVQRADAKLYFNLKENLRSISIEYIKKALFNLGKLDPSHEISIATDINYQLLFFREQEDLHDTDSEKSKQGLLVDFPDINEFLLEDTTSVNTTIKYLSTKLKFMYGGYFDTIFFMNAIFNKVENGDVSFRKIIKIMHLLILFKLFENEDINFEELTVFQNELKNLSDNSEDKNPDKDLSNVLDSLELAEKTFSGRWKVSSFNLPFLNILGADEIPSGTSGTSGTSGENLGSLMPEIINIKQLVFKDQFSDQYSNLFKAVADICTSLNIKELTEDLLLNNISADEIQSRIL